MARLMLGMLRNA